MRYSLKHLPECYPRPVPPKTSRWFAVLAAMLVISVILMRIFGRYIDNNHFWLVAIGTPVVVWIISFGFRMWHWSLQDSKANSFDRHRERWILSETRKARRALQILNMTFITAHKEDKQGSVAVEILKNHSIIISQSDWKGEKGKRLSRITTEPGETPELVDGRFPFAISKSDSSLPMLAEFVRKDSGRIERFLTTELGGVLHKEGSQWVPDKVNSQGLSFNPAFLRAINQLSQLSDILFTDGSQGISFELQARPVPQVVETQLTIDGQKLHYFNQMADWQSFRWPGDTYKPGTMLTWTTVNAGARLFGDYSGTWGFIRWLDESKREQLDRSQWMMSFTAPDGRTLQWVLRSQLGSGPLALLALRGFTLPDQIFSVDSAAMAQALMTNTENSDMDGVE